MNVTMNTCQFGKHHVVPELSKVQNHEQDNDHTQNKHVLRSPFNTFRTSVDGITVVTASLTILQSQDNSIHEVHDYTCSQHQCTEQSIPVRTQQTANHVIRFTRKYCRNVHT